MGILLTNIKTLVGTEEHPKNRLVGKDMSMLHCIDDAFLWFEDDRIKDFGKMADLSPEIRNQELTQIDAVGKCVVPSWCDSHTHLVYASPRDKEFVDRINGLTYEEIARRGGGILNSATALRETSEEVLYTSAYQRLNEIMMQGTGAVEIKSGYGLSVNSELKMLRVIKRLQNSHPLTIKSTFLGAHAVPAEYKDNKAKYIDLLIHDLMPEIAKEGLADYCDVFCERGYFTKEETIRILEAAKVHGMAPKVHAEQLSHSGGIEAGVQVGAISVDHLEYCNDNDIKFLGNSDTMATLLPGAQFFLQLPHPPARKMINSRLAVALASDYNPGSSPSGNMNLIVAIACIQYKMTPEEAINAATLNSAYAMNLSKTHGSIARGKMANVFITKRIPGYGFIPYAFGSNLIDKVIVNGKVQSGTYN